MNETHCRNYLCSCCIIGLCEAHKLSYLLFLGGSVWRHGGVNRRGVDTVF